MKGILAATATITAAVCLSASADTPSNSAPTRAELISQGRQLASTVCVACHGLDGMSPIPANPNIAGMPEQYIANQLALFQSGKRKNPIMQGIVGNLTPEAMRSVGAYYFSQRYKANAVPTKPELIEVGKRIFRSGVADRKVPPCASCHGGGGAGIPSIYPRLAGQWPEYTREQLRLYSTGERQNPQMQEIAARLNPGERDAVAEYVAGMRAR